MDVMIVTIVALAAIAIGVGLGYTLKRKSTTDQRLLAEESAAEIRASDRGLLSSAPWFLYTAASSGALLVLVETSSVGGNATCLADPLRGGHRESPGLHRGRRDEFFAKRRKEFLCEREGNCKVV